MISVTLGNSARIVTLILFDPNHLSSARFTRGRIRRTDERMTPLKKWDNGRDVVLAGDAAGVVAPASGEGIYYGMYGGRVAAEAVEELLVTGNGKVLAKARKRFMKEHGTVFLVLGIMQRFWYNNDKRRERFVKMCEDKDVQRLTFESYMNKKLVRRDPLAHFKIFLKDTAHLLGFAKV